MNCRSAEHLFSSFIEDELSQKERGSLESHLAECRRCSAAVEELRTTVELVAALPSYEPGPHFEEELMDRIRSGEALRPTIVEWMSEWLAPARLRPVFLAGAAGCAAWIAFLVVNPAQHANPIVAGPAPSTTASAPSSGGADLAPIAPVETPAPPAGSETIAAGPRREHSPSGGDAPYRTASSATGSDSARAGAPYQDEYILDQFYLNRTNGSDRTSIVPVTGRPSDDVYITF
ncbi:MAG TPA: zf-HC2 domain-containing protein [Candidatus Limnocylindrales bacterium]|nr:zf-HC2 domain-containing protein [Candidatus Limnocylindrales bacterium]